MPILIGPLCGVLILGGAAYAENGWTLWERQINFKGQPLGEWQRKQAFEEERWCRGAMTIAINLSMRAGGKGGRPDPTERIAEYQCLPAGKDARKMTAP